MHDALEAEGQMLTAKVLCTQLMCVAVVTAQLQHIGVPLADVWGAGKKRDVAFRPPQHFASLKGGIRLGNCPKSRTVKTLKAAIQQLHTTQSKLAGVQNTPAQLLLYGGVRRCADGNNSSW